MELWKHPQRDLSNDVQHPLGVHPACQPGPGCEGQDPHVQVFVLKTTPALIIPESPGSPSAFTLTTGPVSSFFPNHRRL